MVKIAKWPLYSGIIFLSVILDQWTKELIVKKFQWGESVSVVDYFFHITYVRNTGAAFGFLSQAPGSFRVPFFTLLPLIALGVIFYLVKKLPANQKLLVTAFSLVTGGAIGNLIDRLRYGYVVDFLDFHWNQQAHFPAFNVADSAICIGVGILILDMLINPDNKSQTSHS